MKEVEFRAYDARKNKMIFGPTDDNPNSSWVLVCAEANNLPLMQWTNFLDCNKVKIFEDDIAKMKCEWGIWYCLVKYGNGGIAAFGYVGKDDNYLLAIDDIHHTQFEIIGNIHQNPELIEMIDKKANKNRKPTV